MSKYLEIVSFWVKELVQDDSKYSIKEEENGRNILINVDIDKAFMGKIIGKNGNIISSIRNLLNTLSKKDKKNIKVIVKDI